jgi:hypothetical protein
MTARRVFTSPTPDMALAVTQAVDGGAGVLYSYGRYQGDILNFVWPPSWPATRASRSRRCWSPTTSPAHPRTALASGGGSRATSSSSKRRAASLEAMELTVADLARRYPSTSAATLLDPVATQYRDVGRLLEGALQSPIDAASWSWPACSLAVRLVCRPAPEGVPARRRKRWCPPRWLILPTWWSWSHRPIAAPRCSGHRSATTRAPTGRTPLRRSIP